MNFEGTTFHGQKFHLSLTITFRKFLWISRFLKLVCLYFDELLDLINKKIKQHSFKSILGGNLFISISFKYEHLSKIFRRKVRKHLFWVWNNTIKKKFINILWTNLIRHFPLQIWGEISRFWGQVESWERPLRRPDRRLILVVIVVTAFGLDLRIVIDGILKARILFKVHGFLYPYLIKLLKTRLKFKVHVFLFPYFIKLSKIRTTSNLNLERYQKVTHFPGKPIFSQKRDQIINL